MFFKASVNVLVVSINKHKNLSPLYSYLNPMNTPLKLTITGLVVVAIVAAFALGRVTGSTPEIVNTSASESYPEMTEMRAGGTLSFINPLLECDNYHASNSNAIVAMENDIRNYITLVQREGKASAVSVYYRGLSFGPWVGINEKETYSPASLVKVPLMMAVLKKAQDHAGILQEKLQYTTRLTDVPPGIRDPDTLKRGVYYSVEDLMGRMIKHSDNEAKEMLLRFVGFDYFMQVIKDMGIDTHSDLSADFLSPKDYSRFFRLLYNATYLNREMSNKALAILCTSTFSKGVVAGVPSGVKVAHKFGERYYLNSDQKQLHECGIVYLQNAPYLICVMTRGNNFDSLATVISGVSALVYKNVR